MLDIIIPVLNEEGYLTKNRHYFIQIRDHARLIFVDGGSADQTVALASEFGEVFSLNPPRSLQRNYGANQARSPYLLFLNVDCQVGIETLNKIPAYLDRHQAGCLSMKIDDPRRIFRLYERVVNAHCRKFGAVDADLGICITRQLFFQLRGFDEIPIMDDIAFSKKIRTKVKIQPLGDPITVSSRRWHEHGFVKTFGFYGLAYLQYWSGIPFIKSE